jgi:ppGpp synthetase/RelA/SpoT-type nucleotidyltranferase
MASLDFEIENRNFIEWHAKFYPSLRAAEKTYRNLLHLLLSDINNLPRPKIISRLKDRDECITKFQRKYQANLELEKSEYEIKNEITDIIGIRVICLYESNIDVIVAKLKSNFQLLDEINKTKELQSQDDKFGYKGQHLDLKLNNKRSSLPEYKNLKHFSFEVQIRTITQDAWSEIDHKLKYKKDLPKSMKRRVNTLASLFELADREFDSLREETEKLVTAELEKDEQGNPIEQQLNPFNFLKLANAYYPTYHFLEERIEEFVDNIRDVKSDVTINEVEDAMHKHFKKIDEYRNWCLENVGRNLNPYTEMRHILYLYNNGNFNDIMFNASKKRLNTWIVEGTTFSKK